MPFAPTFRIYLSYNSLRAASIPPELSAVEGTVYNSFFIFLLSSTLSFKGMNKSSGKLISSNSFLRLVVDSLGVQEDGVAKPSAVTFPVESCKVQEVRNNNSIITNNVRTAPCFVIIIIPLSYL